MTAAGRPSIFSPELADSICSKLADGESLRSICSADDMPSTGTVLRWVGENETFRDQYARAREIQAETLADSIVFISDGDQLANDAVGVARDRLRVDARKWVASKLLPKKYGDKIQTEHSGSVAITHEDALKALGE